MATQQTQFLARTLLAPSVLLLFVWMVVPLALTIYFSTLHYSLLDPGSERFIELENFEYFLTDPAFARLAAEHARAGRLGAWHHDSRRRSAALLGSTNP